MEKDWTGRLMPRLDGRVALVTGGNRGLGYYTSLELARAGAEVIVAARDLEAAAAARSAIILEAKDAKVRVELLDLASLASIRALAERLAGTKLDLLINNAGVMSIAKREVTEDGFERQIGTNHLGHFALTGLLLPLLAESAAARVVTVSSALAGGARLDFTNLQSESRYSPQGAYEVSKLANQMFMLELSRRLPDNVISVGAHPGVASTDLPQSGFSKWIHKKISQHPSVGALPQLYAAGGDEVAANDYFGPSKWFGMAGSPQKAKVTKRALDAQVSSRLWSVSETLTGIRFGPPSERGSSDGQHRVRAADPPAAREVAALRRIESA